jgi:hemerythrin-like domain-containing protein
VCDHCGCRSFGAIADLTADHERILAAAWNLAEAAAGHPDRPALTAAVLALLDPHVEKEERGLYPRLVEQGALSPEANAVLETEHLTLRSALTGGRFDRRDYYALAAHIEEEEMELFPAAMFGFDDDVWETLDDIAASVRM